MTNRMDSLEKKMDEHIHDGIGVWTAIEGLKIDITWIKRGLLALIGLGVTILGILLKIVVFHINP